MASIQIIAILCLFLSAVTATNLIHPCHLKQPLTANDPLGSHLLLESDDDFDLRQLLLTTFRKNPSNTYNIRRFGFTKDGGTERCIVVRYYIQCLNSSDDTLNETCTDVINKTCGIDQENTDWTFLWTSFDTGNIVGRILLRLAVFDLRVFGFELCDVYKLPVTVTFTLDLNSGSKIYSKSCDTICKVIRDFTTLVSQEL